MFTRAVLRGLFLPGVGSTRCLHPRHGCRERREERTGPRLWAAQGPSGKFRPVVARLVLRSPAAEPPPAGSHGAGLGRGGMRGQAQGPEAGQARSVSAARHRTAEKALKAHRGFSPSCFMLPRKQESPEA